MRNNGKTQEPEPAGRTFGEAEPPQETTQVNCPTEVPVDCPYCQEPIEADAEKCPHCGEALAEPEPALGEGGGGGGKTVLIVVLIVVFGIVGLVCVVVGLGAMTFTSRVEAAKSQALRQAMLTTMQIYPDPKDWAAFTLIGEAE